MAGVSFYRDEGLPYFTLKVCSAEHMSYKKHYHEEYSLGLVERGASRFWHEGRQVDVLPDGLVLIPPEVVHACNPRDLSQWRYKMLFVQPGWVDALGRDGRDAGWRQAVRCLPGALKPVAEEAAGCLMGGATPLATESAVLALFAALGAADGEKATVGREVVRVRRVREYLGEHCRERVTLDALEAVAGLSKCYLVKAFKREYGVPPHVYQTMLRVNFAARELRRRRGLASVAQDSGFYDQSHFTKTFRSHTGVTPEAYQKAYRGC